MAAFSQFPNDACSTAAQHIAQENSPSDVAGMSSGSVRNARLKSGLAFRLMRGVPSRFVAVTKITFVTVVKRRSAGHAGSSTM